MLTNERLNELKSMRIFDFADSVTCAEIGEMIDEILALRTLPAMAEVDALASKWGKSNFVEQGICFGKAINLARRFAAGMEAERDELLRLLKISMDANLSYHDCESVLEGRSCLRLSQLSEQDATSILKLCGKRYRKCGVNLDFMDGEKQVTPLTASVDGDDSASLVDEYYDHRDVDEFDFVVGPFPVKNKEPSDG